MDSRCPSVGNSGNSYLLGARRHHMECRLISLIGQSARHFSEWRKHRVFRGAGPLKTRKQRIFALITLLIAAGAGFLVLVPHVLLGRGCCPNDGAVPVNLRELVSSLEMYRGVHHGGYPDEWMADMYTNADPDFGHPAFAYDIQSTTQLIQGYDYHYTPLPSGCTVDDCTAFTVTAIPHEYKRTGSRSFFVNESAQVRHCIGVAADAEDEVVDKRPRKCRQSVRHFLAQ
jgi:hypothetical protein